MSLIVRVLAVWRLTQLIVDDEITRPLRDKATGRFAYALSCRRCMSVWAALAVAIAPAWLARVLAWSAFSILVDEWRDERAAVALHRRMHAAASEVRQRRESEPGAA